MFKACSGLSSPIHRRNKIIVSSKRPHAVPEVARVTVGCVCMSNGLYVISVKALVGVDNR